MKRLVIPLLAAGLCASLSADVSVFQEGVNGYAGTADTEIRGGSPDQPGGGVTELNPDSSDGGGEVHVLLRFDNIIGNGPGQIPPGKQIFSVVLTLTVTGEGDIINFHRMTKAWTEAVTWNEFDPVNGDGVLTGNAGGRTADDTEALLAIDGTFDPSPTGVYDIVLDPATVQAWVDGTAQNYGWALLPTGSDGVDFASSEYGTATDRPKLMVTYGEAGQPYVVGLQNTGPDGFDVVLEDGFGPGASQIDPATIQVQLDGVDVATTTSKAGTRTTVTYETTQYLLAGSQHAVTISFSDNGSPATPQSSELSFTADDYVDIPVEYAVDEAAVNKSLTGFRVHVHHITADADGATVRSNNLPDPLVQLIGGILDPDTGQPYPNDIYRENPQVASTYTWVPFDANDTTVIDTVINWEHTKFAELLGTQPVDAGNFIPDDPVPGIPGATANVGADDDDTPAFNNIAAEVVCFLELEQGLHRMGVNSDDGFLVDTGLYPSDWLDTLRLGVYDGGRGASDSIFLFNVLQAGIYPFRLVWWEGNGGASLEWFTMDRLGTKTLVNDTATAAVPAYQEGPSQPFIKSVSPLPDATNVPLLDSIRIVLQDGTLQVQGGSIELALNGEAVTPGVSKAGGLTTITYAPPSGWQEDALIQVSLTFSDNGATPHVRTSEFSFNTAFETQVVFAIDDTMMWRYHNEGADLGTAWREVGYDDSAWPQGAALLTAGEGTGADTIRTATLSRTSPSGGNIVTDYFRGRFTLTELPFGGRLQLRHVVDDAVRFYINGVEVHSFGLTGDITYQTTGGDHENAYEGPFLITADNLVVGENVIAAEVHQTSATSSDMVFGAELSVVTSVPPYPQVLSRSPAPDAVDVAVDTNIQIELLDGAGEVQTDSIQMSINDESVTPTVTKAGAITTVSYDPPENLPENSLIKVDLAYSDNSSPPNSGSDSYTFTTGFDPANWNVIIAIDDTMMWRYVNDGSDQGTAWRETTFDDSAWPEGAALLAFETGSTVEPIRTTLTRMSPGSTSRDIITDYFRGRFTLDSVPAGGQMLLRHVVDDSVVVYINGVEVHRFLLLEGDIDYLTEPPTDHENTYEGPYLITPDNLVVGENVVAAEVHQRGATSSDMVFGLELSVPVGGQTADPEIDPPIISGSDITITWSNGGELQTSPDLQTWEGTGNSSGSFSEPLGTSGNKYYRVVRP